MPCKPSLWARLVPSPPPRSWCGVTCTDTGAGGWVDKSKCQASCNSNATRDSKEYLGYIGAVIAVLCFGSNFVPVKQYETGDGERGVAGYPISGWLA